MSGNLSLVHNSKTIRLSNAVAAGTSDVNGTGVNMANFEVITFYALLGTLSSSQVTSMHAQGSDDNGSSDAYADLLGTSLGAMADDDDNQLLILEIVKPGSKWVRPVLDRATGNAVIDGIIAVLTQPRNAPVTKDDDVSLQESHVSPTEGTA